MQMSFLATVEAVVYEPVSANHDTTREALLALGIVNIAFAANLDDLRMGLAARSPDLLLCDVDRASQQVYALIQALRLGGATPNPFLTVVGMTWSQDDDVAAGLRDAGADDVLHRPFTAESLGACLSQQIERRKKFVVTADYIGPDRRRDPSRSGAECFETVNSLRLKSLDLGRADYTQRLARELAASRSTLNAERLRRNAFQLCVQWRLLERRRFGAPDFRAALQTMRAIASDTASRLNGEGQAGARECCAALDASLCALERAVDLARDNHPMIGIDLRMSVGDLGDAVMVLARLFAPGDLEPANLLALDQLVARIDVRRAEIAAPDAFSPGGLRYVAPLAQAG